MKEEGNGAITRLTHPGQLSVDEDPNINLTKQLSNAFGFMDDITSLTNILLFRMRSL